MEAQDADAGGPEVERGGVVAPQHPVGGGGRGEVHHQDRPANLGRSVAARSPSARRTPEALVHWEFLDTPARPLVDAVEAVPLGAALAGWVDWARLDPLRRRTGLVHALINTTGVLRYAGSLVARGCGRLLGLAGLAAVSGGAALGGHLSYRQAAAPDRAAAVPPLAPANRVGLGPVEEFPTSEPVRRRAGELVVVVVVVRDAERCHVLAERCAHLSGPLAEGAVVDGCLRCPWHGSEFRLRAGQVARGPPPHRSRCWRAGALGAPGGAAARSRLTGRHRPAFQPHGRGQPRGEHSRRSHDRRRPRSPAPLQCAETPEPHRDPGRRRSRRARLCPAPDRADGPRPGAAAAGPVPARHAPQPVGLVAAGDAGPGLGAEPPRRVRRVPPAPGLRERLPRPAHRAGVAAAPARQAAGVHRA
ncbi:Rieske 2Fe-2S domain-containing protein [Kitasatospora sp. NPDC018058]|uniref:Rieske 2Fe-2S domain-containing protein n=1 Tax=Kitasatospora sp. NPDC018058 TaxID=3364025 RepID=UPI0037BFFAC1